MGCSASSPAAVAPAAATVERKSSSSNYIAAASASRLSFVRPGRATSGVEKQLQDALQKLTSERADGKTDAPLGTTFDRIILKFPAIRVRTDARACRVERC